MVCTAFLLVQQQGMRTEITLLRLELQSQVRTVQGQMENNTEQLSFTSQDLQDLRQDVFTLQSELYAPPLLHDSLFMP